MDGPSGTPPEKVTRTDLAKQHLAVTRRTKDLADVLLTYEREHAGRWVPMDVAIRNALEQRAKALGIKLEDVAPPRAPAS